MPDPAPDLNQNLLDADLAFLHEASDDDIEPLVGYIEKAFSERLSKDPLFALYGNVPKKSRDESIRRTLRPPYLKAVENDLRLFGGNTIANFFRGGEGPGYSEIARDVADKIGAKYGPDDAVGAVEESILLTFLGKAWEKMGADDRMALLKEIDPKDLKVGNAANIPAPPALVAAAQAAIRASGFKAYKIAVIVANQIAKKVLGRGLSFAANAMLTKGFAALVGPIGWVVTTAWMLADLASPAFRVTYPCVLHIAMLRLRYSKDVVAARQDAEGTRGRWMRKACRWLWPRHRWCRHQ
jgi:uncharacterized protein YaaW (UPF0174 family)